MPTRVKKLEPYQNLRGQQLWMHAMSPSFLFILGSFNKAHYIIIISMIDLNFHNVV